MNKDNVEVEKDSHYHSITKRCKIIARKYYVSEGRCHLIGGYCRTHKKEICRCGWEWYWHYGIHHLPKKWEWQKNQKNQKINKKKKINK